MPLWRIAVRVEGAEAAGALSDVFDALTGSVSAFETREGKLPEWLVETYAATALVDAALDLRLTLAATAAGGKILDLIGAGDATGLAALSSKELLDNGDVELRSWIATLGAIGDGVKPELLIYEPFYRAIMGMGVAYWPLS